MGSIVGHHFVAFTLERDFNESLKISSRNKFIYNRMGTAGPHKCLENPSHIISTDQPSEVAMRSNPVIVELFKSSSFLFSR